jgi:hypothetical protein
VGLETDGFRSVRPRKKRAAFPRSFPYCKGKTSRIFTPLPTVEARRSEKRSRKREASVPPLFVAVHGKNWYEQIYAKAKIRVRKGCYASLVWSDGGRKREFCLRQIWNLTPARAWRREELRDPKGG